MFLRRLLLACLLPALLLTSGCRAKTAEKPGTLFEWTEEHRGRTVSLDISLPVKALPDSQPLVLFVPAALDYEHLSASNRNHGSFFNILDFYLNNAGISLARFTSGQASTRRAGQDPRTLRKLLSAAVLGLSEEGYSPLILAAQGSAALPVLATLPADRVAGAVLLAPVQSPFPEILRWRLLDWPREQFFRCFDIDGDGQVLATEFAEDPYRDRQRGYTNTAYTDFDSNKDGRVTGEDFLKSGTPAWEALQTAIKSGDSKKLAELDYGPEAPLWLQTLFHEQLTNRTYLSNLYQSIRKPLFIVHGTEDSIIPVAESLALKKRLGQQSNVQFAIFPVHDHYLNLDEYAQTGQLTTGLHGLIDAFFSAVRAGTNQQSL